MTPREIVKRVMRAAAFAGVLPSLASFHLRAGFIGRDRALEGSTQALAHVPGLIGQYMRRAFLQCTLAHCAPTALIEFGTIFSSADARIEDRAYIGPGCYIGLAHIGCDVLIAANVHVPSGRLTHGFSDPDVPIREQPGRREVVRIGPGAWIGSATVVMADIGPGTVVGAGAVVTKPVPAWVVAGGVPARVLRARAGYYPEPVAVAQ